MNIKPIKNPTSYRAALKQIEGLMQARANTPAGDLLDVLTTLVESYERAHFPMDLPDAVEAIKFRMGPVGADDQRPGARNRPTESRVRNT